MTRGDQGAPCVNQRVRLVAQKKVLFDVQKENRVLFYAHDNFIDKNKASKYTTILILDDGPILEMPQRFDQLFQIKLTEKVTKLKNFFKSCLALIKDKDVVEELSSLVEEPQPSVRPEKKVNHIGERPKTGRELRVNAQIGDYDMDFIILDLGLDINIMTR